MSNFSMSVQRTAGPLQAWHLVDADDVGADRVVTMQEKMFDVIEELATKGWRGAVTSGNGAFRLELNADDPARQIIAAAGDWVILDYFGPIKLDDAGYTANYEEAQA